MPRKVRDLIRDLESAGFRKRGGKGSHRNMKHPKGVQVTVSGQLNDDAKDYQEQKVRKAIEDAQS